MIASNGQYTAALLWICVYPHHSSLLGSSVLVFLQLQHKLEANQEAESLQKRVKILHGRLEKERQKVSDLESSLKQAREAASHSHVPKPEQSTVNNKV